MPRNGSGVYSKPAGTTAVPNTTIESAKFNSVVDDIAADLNAARPVSAGGTGGTTVAGARSALVVPTYVATRTALKALDTTKDTVAFLKESGREGIFKWTSGDFSTHITADASEGIYVKADAIASTSGAWVRVYDGSASVLWFGATADGTTDDLSAIQAAINAIADLGLGSLFFPKGRYRITNFFKVYEECELVGAGRATEIFLDSSSGSGSGQAILTRHRAQDFSEMCYGIRIANMTIDTDNGINDNGIGIGKCRDSVFENLWFTNVGRKAITVQIAVYNNVVRNIFIEDAATEVGGILPAVSIEGITTITGTAQSGGASTIQLAASGPSSTDGYYTYTWVEITGGTGSGQIRMISAYNGTTKTATVSEAWTTPPDATSTYRIGEGYDCTGNIMENVVAQSTAGNFIAIYDARGNTVRNCSCDTVGSSETGTAQAGAASTITLASGANATDDYYNQTTIEITSGTGSGQQRQISDYVGSTKVATVSSNWTTNPDSTSVYRIVKGSILVYTDGHVSDNVVENVRTKGDIYRALVREEDANGSGNAYRDISAKSVPHVFQSEGAVTIKTDHADVEKVTLILTSARNALRVSGANVTVSRVRGSQSVAGEFALFSGDYGRLERSYIDASSSDLTASGFGFTMDRNYFNSNTTDKVNTTGEAALLIGNHFKGAKMDSTRGIAALNSLLAGSVSSTTFGNNLHFANDNDTNATALYRMGDDWFWFDATGDLRCKNATAPTSLTDGVVVGTQS